MHLEERTSGDLYQRLILDSRWKMAILITCIVILLHFDKSKAASRPGFNITGCTLMTEQPTNSFVSCTFDRELDGYTSCLYVCRAGYHFEDAEYDRKTVFCFNGFWLFASLGDCVARQEEVSTSSCLSKPSSPKNSFISCKFSKNLTKYTNCNFICRRGYFFQDGTDEKKSVCRDGSWLPVNHGHCLADDARNETTNSIPDSCSSRPQPPLNSFDYCIFDKESRGYRKCNYYCKIGYHFYSNLSRLTQYCLGGSWKSRAARDCIKENIQGPPCWKKMDDPENSFTNCVADSNSVGYSECRYACKEGYYFHGDVYMKTQFCTNGQWKPNKIGNCVNASERYSNTAYECTTFNVPRRSTASCEFSENLGMYTSCTFTCHEGYYFPGKLGVKIQNCVEEKWKPRRVENCDYQ